MSLKGIFYLVPKKRQSTWFTDIKSMDCKMNILSKAEEPDGNYYRIEYKRDEEGVKIDSFPGPREHSNQQYIGKILLVINLYKSGNIVKSYNYRTKHGMAEEDHFLWSEIKQKLDQFGIAVEKREDQ
tara:strand:- start:1305 stop:1685 length:381 start_codon:yes stop_codon:yes gene_type:complete